MTRRSQARDQAFSTASPDYNSAESTAAYVSPHLMESYQIRSREVMQLIDKLRDEGASAEISLPTIVFCGNQSSGKSSLVEAITGVCLPRSDGTCTRCVMEVRMIDSKEPWSCSVWLQYKYDSSGARVNEPTELLFEDDIQSSSDVELSARRAQKAILNPKTKMESFQSYVFNENAAAKEAKQNELKFTPNTVLIKINGSGSNLTLIDLPGIICSTEKRSDRQMIGLIENMVKSHIENPNSLIVATISCKDEVENQAILSFAQEVDPVGIRTIGVLTKPDTIETSCHENWFDLLENRRFGLKLGYYVVKNPNKQELNSNIDFAAARIKENSFFSQKEPWFNSSLASKSRMGVDNLREALSCLLVNMIETNLPLMRIKVEELLEESNAQLLELPPSVSNNPKLEVLSIFKKLDSRLKALATAKSLDKSFYHSIDELFSEFSNEIKITRPILFLPESKKPTNFKPTFASDEYLHFGDATHFNEFGIDRILKVIRDQRGREFCQFMRHEVFHEIIKVCQTNWEESALGCLKEILKVVKKHYLQEIEQCFGKWPNFAWKMRLAFDKLIKQETNRVRPKVLEIFTMESRFPTTWDTQRFNDLTNVIHERLEKTLNPTHGLPVVDKLKNRSIYDLFDLGDTFLNINHKRPRPSDPLDENVLKTMEMAQAYYSISSSRFTDNVCMTIYHNLIESLSSNAESYLLESLGFTNSVFSDEDCLKLFEEKPAVNSKRKKILSQISRLEEIHRLILSGSST